MIDAKSIFDDYESMLNVNEIYKDDLSIHWEKVFSHNVEISYNLDIIMSCLYRCRHGFNLYYIGFILARSNFSILKDYENIKEYYFTNSTSLSYGHKKDYLLSNNHNFRLKMIRKPLNSYYEFVSLTHTHNIIVKGEPKYTRINKYAKYTTCKKYKILISE